MENNKAVRLTESAIMLAFAAILSVLPIVELPFGGSITACSMLPIILIAYRYGTGWGLFTAFSYSLLQMLFGLKNLSYATSVWAAAAIIFLDYVAAFTLLGLGGIFRKRIRSQSGALAAGTLFVCALRYVCHVISGCTVWEGVSIPSADGLAYSLVYNATYMIPETFVTIVGAVYIARLLDFRNESINRAAPREKVPDLAVLYRGLAAALLGGAVIYDVARVFGAIQGDGKFDITQISTVNGGLLALVAGIGAAAAVVFGILASKVPKDDPADLSKLFSIVPLAGIVAAVAADVAYVIVTIANGPVSSAGWVKMLLLTASVAVFAVFVIKRYRAKRRFAV